MIRRYLYYILFVFAASPHVIELPPWSSIVAFSFWALALAANLGAPTRLHRRLVQGLTLALPAAVYWEFQTLLGPEASTSLFIMLVGLKLHELDSDRDRFIFLIFITLVVMYWLLFSQTLLTTLYMLVMMFAVGVALVTTHSPQRSLKEIWASTPRFAFFDFVLVIPIFLAFFLLFPRFTTPFSRFMPIQKDLTGFSGELRPGDMASLAQSDEVAFRALFDPDEMPHPRDLYWRGMTLTLNEGLTWRRRKVFAPAPARKIDSERPSYEIVLEPRFNKTLFFLEPVDTGEFKDRNLYNQIVEFQDDYLESRFPLIHRVVISGRTKSQKSRHDLALSLAERQHNLQYALAGTQKARQWIESLNEKDSKALARRILEEFRKNFSYSRTTPTMESLDDFLFRYRQGFCEHFASSFSALMRMAGVPARVIIGYLGGEYNEYGGYWVVRDRHAHAWSEIWIDGEGWVRVDPTMVVNQQRFSFGDALLAQSDDWSRWATWWHKGRFLFEAINSEYVLFLVNFNSKYQLDLFSFGGRFEFKRWMLFILLIPVVGLTLLLLYFATRDRKPLDAVEKRYRRLLKILEKKGFRRRDTEGPLDFAKRMRSSPIDERTKQLLFDYVDVRYGPYDLTKQSAFLRK